MFNQERVGKLLLRLSTILIVAGVLLSLPDPTAHTVVPYKNALVCLVTVIVIGVLIYDTFFYDRHG